VRIGVRILTFLLSTAALVLNAGCPPEDGSGGGGGSPGGGGGGGGGGAETKCLCAYDDSYPPSCEVVVGSTPCYEPSGFTCQEAGIGGRVGCAWVSDDFGGS